MCGIILNEVIEMILKPCPKCGYEAFTKVYSGDNRIILKIVCPKCGYEVSGRGYPIQNGSSFGVVKYCMARTVDEWNRRDDDES